MCIRDRIFAGVVAAARNTKLQLAILRDIEPLPNIGGGDRPLVGVLDGALLDGESAFHSETPAVYRLLERSYVIASGYSRRYVAISFDACGVEIPNFSSK